MLQARPFSLNDIMHLNLSIVWKVAALPRRGDDRRTIKIHRLDMDDCLIAATCVINKARADHVKIIFLQPQFNQQIAASIAQAIDGAVMPMDDLAYDVVTNLAGVAQEISASKRERTE